MTKIREKQKGGRRMTAIAYNRTAIGNLKYLLQHSSYPVEILQEYFPARGLDQRDVKRVISGEVYFEDIPEKKPSKKVFGELDNFDSLHQERTAIIDRYAEVIEANQDYTFFKRNGDGCLTPGEYYVFARLWDGTLVPASYATTRMSPNVDNPDVLKRVQSGQYRFPPRLYFQEALYYPKKLDYTKIRLLNMQS